MTQSHRTVEPPSPDAAGGYKEATEFLYDRINYERLVSGTTRYPFRLQRIADLMRRLSLGGYLHSDSQRPPVPLVHIAGTKGKGSTAAMVASILTASGLRTGLYTSPHLHLLEERFRINGKSCGANDIVNLVQRIRPVAEQIEPFIGAPSFFELTTAMALLHFDSQDCEAVVIEVGLGGRLDSTNVCASSVTAVTSIGLDHQNVLGNNLATIAAEKAGIIKPGVPVVSGVRDEAIAEVVESQARESGSPFYQLGRSFLVESEPSPHWGSNLSYTGLQPPLRGKFDVPLRMDGEHQAANAGLAIAMVELLRGQGVEIGDDAIQSGLGQLQCAGRIERFMLDEDVLAIIDSAHNQDSISALRDCLQRRSADRPVTVVFGTSIDKSAEPMLRLLSDVTERLILTRFHGNPRFRRPEELRAMIPPSLVERTEVLEDPIEACRRGLSAATPGGTLVVCGSFFLAAETRHWVAERSVDGSKKGV